MSEPYLGEIRLMSYPFPPRGWMPCQGQILSISTNSALFSLLGTTYGGNGSTTFQLPDLRGRVVAHVGSGAPLGTAAGQETVTLTSSEMPAHFHAVMAAAGNANSAAFNGALISGAVSGGNPVNVYADAGSPVQALSPACVSMQGGSQPHENCQPSLVLNYCIAVSGVYPSRN
jgi:microcystin-dependent protein